MKSTHKNFPFNLNYEQSVVCIPSWRNLGKHNNIDMNMIHVPIHHVCNVLYAILLA